MNNNLHLMELKKEIDAYRKQINALTGELSAQRVGFATYKASAEAQLSELRKQKATLGHEVLALRRKLSGAGAETGDGPTTAAATRREEKTEAPDRGTEDYGAAPDNIRSKIECDEQISAASIGIKSEPVEDETIKISRNIAEVYGAAVDMLALMGDARPTTPGTALATTSNPDRAENVQRASLGKKVSGHGAARDRVPQKDRVMLQRMILIRHASQCTAPEGTCKASRHCDATRAVWKHILEDRCTDPNCKVRHCVSTRYVLRHYRRWCASPLSRGAVCRLAKSSNSV